MVFFHGALQMRCSSSSCTVCFSFILLVCLLFHTRRLFLHIKISCNFFLLPYRCYSYTISIRIQCASYFNASSNPTNLCCEYIKFLVVSSFAFFQFFLGWWLWFAHKKNGMDYFEQKNRDSYVKSNVYNIVLSFFFCSCMWFQMKSATISLAGWIEKSGLYFMLIHPSLSANYTKVKEKKISSTFLIHHVYERRSEMTANNANAITPNGALDNAKRARDVMYYHRFAIQLVWTRLMITCIA